MDKKKKGQLVGALLVAIGVGVSIALLTGCGAEFLHTAIEGDDGCEPEVIQCENDIWAICNADRVWDTIAVCKEYEPEPRVCCAFGGKVGCHKEEDCIK